MKRGMAKVEPDERSQERRAQHLRSARDGIMLAAARVVVRDGYQRSTMRSIAKEAGYTASSLYTYFESKEQIFSAIRDAMLEQLEGMFAEPLPEGLDFVARVKVLGMRFVKFSEDYQEAIALHLVGGVELPDEDGATRLARLGVVQQLCERWFRDNATEAELGGHRPADVAALFNGVLKAFMEQAFVDARGAPDAEALREHHTRGLGFFFAALSAPPPD